MPNTEKLSKFLKAEHIKDGDIITFVDAGTISLKTFKDRTTGEEQSKDLLEITVEFKGNHKTYSPNGTTINLLNKAWGTNTESWVGQKARVFVVPASNGKDMIIAKPMDEVDQITL